MQVAESISSILLVGKTATEKVQILFHGYFEWVKMELAKILYMLKTYILKFGRFEGRNNLEIKYLVKSSANLKQSLNRTLLSYKTNTPNICLALTANTLSCCWNTKEFCRF